MHANTTRFGQLLQPLREYDAFSSHGLIRDDYFSQRNADADFWTDLARELFVAEPVLSLKCQGCTDGVSGPVELGDKGVAANLVRDATVPNTSLGKLLERLSYAVVCDSLVSLNQRGGTDDVGVENDRELRPGRHGSVRLVRGGSKGRLAG